MRHGDERDADFIVGVIIFVMLVVLAGWMIHDYVTTGVW